MSAPRRWLESEEASAEALELLRAGRPPRRMDDAVRGRSRRRVAGLAMLPAAAGVNLTLIVQALPAGTVDDEQLSAVIVKSSAFTPRSVTVVMAIEAWPELLRVIVRGVLAAPTSWLPKLTLTGSSVACGTSSARTARLCRLPAAIATTPVRLLT